MAFNTFPVLCPSTDVWLTLQRAYWCNNSFTVKVGGKRVPLPKHHADDKTEAPKAEETEDKDKYEIILTNCIESRLTFYIIDQPQTKLSWSLELKWKKRMFTLLKPPGLFTKNQSRLIPTMMVVILPLVHMELWRTTSSSRGNSKAKAPKIRGSFVISNFSKKI